MRASLRQITIILALVIIPVQALAANGDIHSIYNNTPFFAENDTLDCGVQGGGASLKGHTLPASHGGTGREDDIDATGHVSGGGAVTFAQTLINAPADLQPLYRDYYITMRWRYTKWNWNGTSSGSGPEDVDFYSKAPRVLVTNPRTGKSIIAVVLEAGPAPWTGVDSDRNNDPKQGWTNPQDGTPSTYKGRVSGLPPKAFAAVGAAMRMQDGSGDDLQYSWASDQNAKPGPVAGSGGTSTTSADSGATCAGGLGVGQIVFPEKTTQTTIKNAKPFAWCYDKLTSCHHDYKAADIINSPGTPIVAATAGKAIAVTERQCNGQLGGYPHVQFKGDDGKFYYYAHFAPGSLTVKEGDHVTPGQQLGVIGPPACGEGTAHLHFQMSSVRIANTNDTNEHQYYIDPQPLLIEAFKKLPE